MSAVAMPNKKKQEWFAFRGDNKEGPFSYLDLVKMLQEKSLQEYHFVWKPGWPVWKRIADAVEFSPWTIQALREAGDAEIQQVFFRRRHARVNYDAQLLVHNNKSVWQARSLQISQGGAGLVVENPDLEVGQTLFLHFKSGEGVPPFNAIASIVSKRSESRDQSQTTYGVKFTRISQSVTQAIKKYAEVTA